MGLPPSSVDNDQTLLGEIRVIRGEGRGSRGVLHSNGCAGKPPTMTPVTSQSNQVVGININFVDIIEVLRNLQMMHHVNNHSTASL